MAQTSSIISWWTGNPLHELMLATSPPSTRDIKDLYKAIVNDESIIATLLETTPRNYHFRTAVLADPNKVLSNLSSFLRSIQSVILPETSRNGKWLTLPEASADKAIRIPEAFTKHVLFPLANQPAESFDIESYGYQDLILSTLELYLPLATCATVSLRDLRDFFSKLMGLPEHIQVIERIATGEVGARLLTSLLDNNSLTRQIFTDDCLYLFGHRLAKLITNCIASHGSESEDAISVWSKSEDIRKSLEDQLQRIKEVEKTRSVEGAVIEVNDDAKHFLRLARIATPYNVTTAKNTIQGLLERRREKVYTMLSSYPCSACHARPLGLMKTPYGEVLGPRQKDVLEDINAPFGVFPIYVSEAAMRDLKGSRMDGNLPPILATLQRLADGLWESDKTLSLSVGKSRPKTVEFLLRVAQWADNGYILWERGVGRIDEKADKWTQIVKIIRIGPRNDLKGAASAACMAESTYTKEYMQASTIKIPNPNQSGGLIPKTFMGDDAVGLEETQTLTFKPSSERQKLTANDALILHKTLCTDMVFSL
ncbi:hypothetical protein TWF696_005649 [Orbilia brochopaga]|uniref:Uncharacterized protein n=1 Tax=Orbilia brochopaga TaxID=3140254 RepID=A0AAV9V430_9PEZI